jgi:hypothetical protein
MSASETVTFLVTASKIFPLEVLLLQLVELGLDLLIRDLNPHRLALELPFLLLDEALHDRRLERLVLGRPGLREVLLLRLGRLLLLLDELVELLLRDRLVTDDCDCAVGNIG